LQGIQKNDRILISTGDNDYTYQVTSTSIVRPGDVFVLANRRGEKTLTLVTCYPFYFIGNAPKRFIVHAQQVTEGVLDTYKQ
jgi:sortase A